MNRVDAWLQHTANLLVGGTGLAYGWMLYCIPEDPDPEVFMATNHPWQGDVHGLHILAAPLLIFASALIWRGHVWGRFRSHYRGRRKTGVTLMTLFVPMCLSGYLLQVGADEAWQLAWVWLHGVSSCLWILTYLVHQFTRPPKPEPL